MERLTSHLLTNDTKIWRYMDYESLIWTLQTNQIHLHRSDCFDDSLEGSVPTALTEISDKNYGEILADTPEDSSDTDPEEMMKAYAEGMREATFLSCWHINEGESMAMWDLYGRSNKSVAIQSTVGKLSSAVKEPNGGTTYIAPVLYADYNASPDDLDRQSRESLETLFSRQRPPKMTDLYQLKEKSFSHEQELRIIYQSTDIIGEPADESDEDAFTPSGPLPYDTKDSDHFPNDVPATDGFNTTVDIAELIETIHMAPESSKTVKESLSGVLDGDSSIPISSSRLEPTTIPGDPDFDMGPYQFERLVNAVPEEELEDSED
ncbi:DUF2971 domain-containing protein [Halococcus thailandensis]|uniref:DUF2971 domain-containing protein n=1 Tax=Halococcus thailandensis TaxID=335952 RepID=UPI0009B5AF0D|nr:DUF2971 domain-containing protein [Halococcus thailandensis]